MKELIELVCCNTAVDYVKVTQIGQNTVFVIIKYTDDQEEQVHPIYLNQKPRRKVAYD